MALALGKLNFSCAACDWFNVYHRACRQRTGTPKFRGSGCQFPQSQCLPSPCTGIALGTRLHESKLLAYRSFSSDVTAAILVYQNNEMAAILVYGTGISSFLFKYSVLLHHPTGATDHVSENDLLVCKRLNKYINLKIQYSTLATRVLNKTNQQRTHVSYFVAAN